MLIVNMLQQLEAAYYCFNIIVLPVKSLHGKVVLMFVGSALPPTTEACPTQGGDRSG